MKLIERKIFRKDKMFIIENLQFAKKLVENGKLSQEDLEKLFKIDPTPTKKFMGWLAKVWVKEKPDFDELRNKIEKFYVFLEKQKTRTKDINQFKNFEELKTEVDEINDSGESHSLKDLENDYETIIDNEDLLVCVPHTHEASRKLGLTKFSFRKCKEGKDSAWCTTYKAPDHFNNNYYKHNVTLYYIRIKSPNLIKELKKEFPDRYKSLEVIALALLPDGRIDGYDGKDNQIKAPEIKALKRILNID